MKKFKMSYIDLRVYNIKKRTDKPFWTHSFWQSPCGTPHKSKKWTIKILNSIFTIIVRKDQVLKKKLV